MPARAKSSKPCGENKAAVSDFAQCVFVFAVKQLEWPKHGIRLATRAGPPFALGREFRSRQDPKRVAKRSLNHLRVDFTVRKFVPAFRARQHPFRHNSAPPLGYAGEMHRGGKRRRDG